MAFFLWLHFAVRSWAIGADISGGVCNDDGPFGVLVPQWLLVGIGLAALVFVAAHGRKAKLFFLQWPWLLILSGGLGNVLERLSFGCIMDYIALPPFPVFNVADILLTVGAIGIFLGWRWNAKKSHE
ncbi:MAG: signal peptidase II [Candidatus Moraniibacteriota bacterium]